MTRPLALAFGLGWLAMAWLVSGAAIAEPVGPPPDPRFREAESLLGERSAYPRALELYREILAERPDDAVVRHRLAQVLSWDERWEESLAEYERLLAHTSPPADAGVERAEILSWIGRYEESEAAFQDILLDDPDDARAARGLARVYNWSGREAEADRAYARALRLEDDSEARREWSTLRDRHRPTTRAEFSSITDSDGFTLRTGTSEGAFYLGLDTRLTARATFFYAEHEPDVPPATSLGFHSRDRGYQITGEVRHRLSQNLHGELEVGARAWERAGPSAVARGRLEYSPGSRIALAGEIDHREFLEGSESLFAVQQDLRATTATLSVWRGWTERVESYVQLGTGAISDGSWRYQGSGSASYRPWLERGWLLHLEAGAMGDSQASPFYYSPSIDAGGGLAVTWRGELLEKLRLDLEAGAGYGFAREGGLTSGGLAYRFAAGLSWRRGPWRLGVRGARSQSHRRSVYTANRLTAQVGLDF